MPSHTRFLILFWLFLLSTVGLCAARIYNLAGLNPEPQGCKRAAVKGASSQLLQCCHKSSSPVPYMLCKVVLRPLLMILVHQLIPCDLNTGLALRGSTAG